jgi:hypothetical protein
VRCKAETHERIGIAVANAYLDEERRLKDVRRNVTTPYPLRHQLLHASLLHCISRFLAQNGRPMRADECLFLVEIGHAVDITTKTDFDPNPTWVGLEIPQRSSFLPM